MNDLDTLNVHEKLRRAIYENYGHDFQDTSEAFEPAVAKRWGKAYRWYLRGWLPESKDAAIVELACGNGKLLQFFRVGRL